MSEKINTVAIHWNDKNATNPIKTFMDFETPLRNNVPICFHIFCALFPILPWLIFATIIEDFEVDLFLVVFVPFAFLFYVLEFYFLKILGFFGVRAYFSYPLFLLADNVCKYAQA